MFNYRVASRTKATSLRLQFRRDGEDIKKFNEYGHGEWERSPASLNDILNEYFIESDAEQPPGRRTPCFGGFQPPFPRFRGNLSFVRIIINVVRLTLNFLNLYKIQLII